MVSNVDQSDDVCPGICFSKMSPLSESPELFVIP